MVRQVYLYGLAGADSMYRVVRYSYLEGDNISIVNIKASGSWMKVRNPSIKKVYAVDNRRGLLRDYKDAFVGNSIESFAIFKDILEREGVLVDC